MTDDIHRKAAKANTLLAALGAAPSPAAYAVAFRHVSEPAGEVAQAVEALVREGLPLAPGALDALHGRLIEDPRLLAAEGLSGEADLQVAASLEVVQRATASTAGYLASLEEAGGALAGHATPEAAVIRRLRDETRAVAEEQRAARDALAETQARLSDLQARYEGALREARVDPMTRLPNRRAFDEHLVREIARSDRGAGSLCLLMLDVDHFKTVNDTHGHAVGDAVLKAVAEVTRRCVRASDIPGRLGGEEFGVLLPGTDTERGAIVAERIRRAVEAFRGRYGADGRPLPPVTVSMGMAGHRPGETAESLSERADALLYEAKRGGRNRVAGEEGPEPGAGFAP